MARAIHTFDNGVRVFEDQLWEGQRARYQKRNVHEAEEEDIFVDLIRRTAAEWLLCRCWRGDRLLPDSRPQTGAPS